MKWFKHNSNANMDAKLQEILLDYGLEGYGLYWYCVELIAGNVDQENLTFELEHDCRIIARNTGSTVQRVQEMMTKFIELGLFEDSGGIVTCLKLAKVADDYTAKLVRKKIDETPELPDVGESPTNSEKVPLDKIRIDKNRLDKNISKTPKKSSPKKFIKPDLESIEEYFRERDHFNPKAIAEKFLNHYESNGWKVGKNPMKDWKAAVRTWMGNEKNQSNAPPDAQAGKVIEMNRYATAEGSVERLQDTSWADT